MALVGRVVFGFCNHHVLYASATMRSVTHINGLVKRSFAAEKKEAKKTKKDMKEAKKLGPVVMKNFEDIKNDKGQQIIKGVNILKGASDPLLSPDDQYPAWLWELVDSPQKKNDVESKLHTLVTAFGEKTDISELDEDKKRLKKLHKLQIKSTNARSSK